MKVLSLGEFNRGFKLDNMEGLGFTPKKLTSMLSVSDYSRFLHKCSSVQKLY